MHLKDEPLARRAAAGDAVAFAELYDRYERRVYNLCYRITGSPDDAADATQETFLKVLERLPQLRDRELNFAAYVMTVARNASYDAIERRKRSAPTDEIPESAVPFGVGEDHEVPERVALREAHQEQIRLANESLPARQREVLALRELEELSYGEVAQIMGMNQNSVAQLISRARINLRDGLRQTALGSVASASPQCDRALPLLASHQDGLLEDPWLVEHLMGCGACRVRLEAMEEAAVAYRQWLLLVPALWLREETAEAAERVNGDWNRTPGRRPRLHRGRRRDARAAARARLRDRRRRPVADARVRAGARGGGAGRRPGRRRRAEADRAAREEAARAQEGAAQDRAGHGAEADRARRARAGRRRAGRHGSRARRAEGPPEAAARAQAGEDGRGRRPAARRSPSRATSCPRRPFRPSRRPMARPRRRLPARTRPRRPAARRPGRRR